MVFNRGYSDGTRWGIEVGDNLEKTSFGVLCLTPENLTRPWIMFEAGALSKVVSQSFVCPYLFNVEPIALGLPLSMFQAARADREGTKKLVETINLTLGDQKLPERRLEHAFSVWWPQLEEMLKAIPASEAYAKARTDRELLEEMVNLLRSLDRRQSVESLGLLYNLTEQDGRRYRFDDITRSGSRPNLTFEFHGVLPPEGRHWRYNAAQMEQLYEQGLIKFPKSKSGRPRIKRYLDERYLD